MTRLQLQKIDVYQTAPIAEASKDPQTAAYILECLTRFYGGDYGPQIGEEDAAVNNEDLKRGEGHALGRYQAAAALAEDIYIDFHFSESNPGTDYNYGMILYCSEW